MFVVLTRFLDSQTGFLDQLTRFLCNLRHRMTPLTQKLYELICAKISIFPSNMVQETIEFGQEMFQDAQETYHRVQESSLGYKLTKQ